MSGSSERTARTRLRPAVAAATVRTPAERGDSRGDQGFCSNVSPGSGYPNAGAAVETPFEPVPRVSPASACPARGGFPR